MKQILIISSALVILSANIALSKECCTTQNNYEFAQRDYKCSQLINKIRFQKNTLYNVLNLSTEQQELKDEIEFRRQEEVKPYADAYQCEKQKLKELVQTSYGSPEFKKQVKATRKAWKALQKCHKKYDKEFEKILCSTQKAKFKDIVRLTKRDIRYCYLNKKACPKDPYVNTFGLNDAKNLCDICEKHSRAHIFNYKCDFVEEFEK